MATAQQLRDAFVYRVGKILAGDDAGHSPVDEIGGEIGLLIRGMGDPAADAERRGLIKGLQMATHELDAALAEDVVA